LKLPGKGMSWRAFLSALQREWFKDDLSNVAGSVTYSALLAMFPFLIFLVALASLFIDVQKETAIIDSLSQIAPAAVTKLLSDRIHSLATSQHSTSVLTFGFIATLWAASSGVATLMSALNTCYAVTETRPFWRTRGIAVVMTIFGAALSIVATLAAVAVPAIASRMGDVGVVLLWLRLPFAALAIMFLWAVLYYFLPDVEQRFKFITPGSVVGVLLWLLASWAFSLYVSHFGSYEVTYGALGGVVVLLVWMWISAQVLLLGAEINAIIEHKSPEGKRVGARSMSDTGEDTNKSEKEDLQKKRPIVVVANPSSGLRPAAKRWARNLAEAYAVRALLGAVAGKQRERAR
jgi:membrane protein